MTVKPAVINPPDCHNDKFPNKTLLPSTSLGCCRLPELFPIRKAIDQSVEPAVGGEFGSLCIYFKSVDIGRV